MLSTSLASPMRNPSREPGSTWGDALMFSCPPAITICASPHLIAWAARCVAFNPLPHTLPTARLCGDSALVIFISFSNSYATLLQRLLRIATTVRTDHDDKPYGVPNHRCKHVVAATDTSRSLFSLSMQYTSIDLSDIGPAHQREADVQLAAQDFDGLCDTGLPACRQRVQEGLADQTASRPEP